MFTYKLTKTILTTFKRLPFLEFVLFSLVFLLFLNIIFT
jgi:hypothetical protein